MNESLGADLEARPLCCLVFLVSLHGQHNLLLLSGTAGESAEIGSTITHSLCTSLLILWISVCAKLWRRRCWEVYFWLLWWYNYAWHARQLEEKTYACTSLPQWLTRETRAQEFRAWGTIHTYANRYTCIHTHRPSSRTRSPRPGVEGGLLRSCRAGIPKYLLEVSVWNFP